MATTPREETVEETVEEEAAVEEAVRVAVLSLLVYPEYSTEFLDNILINQGVAADDLTRIVADDMIFAKLKELAGPVAAELTRTENIEMYASLI